MYDHILFWYSNLESSTDDNSVLYFNDDYDNDSFQPNKLKLFKTAVLYKQVSCFNVCLRVLKWNRPLGKYSNNVTRRMELLTNTIL
jgi:hypothetical protein